MNVWNFFLYLSVYFSLPVSVFSQSQLTTLLLGFEDNITFRWGPGTVDQFIRPEIIKGHKVKSVTIWQYKSNGEPFASTKNYFDSAGKCIKYFVYGINYKTSWSYDMKGNVSEMIDSGRATLRSHCIYIYMYDKQGLLIKKTSYSVSDTCRKCYYKKKDSMEPNPCPDSCIYNEIEFYYNDKNQLYDLVENTYNEIICEKIHFSFSYNNKNHLTERCEFDTYKYEYNRKGLIVKRETYSSSGRLNEITEFRYNKKGNLTKRIKFDTHSWYEREEITYSPNGLPLTYTNYRGSKNQKKPNYKRYFVYEYY
jgi:hypothetical protein